MLIFLLIKLKKTIVKNDRIKNLKTVILINHQKKTYKKILSNIIF